MQHTSVKTSNPASAADHPAGTGRHGEQGPKEPLFRHAKTADLPALRSLWMAAWPQDEAFAECFLASCFSLSDTCVAEAEGSVRSMFFSLKDYQLQAGGRSYTASYLYALATDPAFFGRGFGSGLSAYTSAEDYRQDIDFVFLYPESPSLREWYRQRLKAVDCFWQRRIDMPLVPDASEPAFGSGSLFEISSEEYASDRKRLLQDTVHMDIPADSIRLQAEACRLYGGGLYRFVIDGRTGICLGETENGHLTLKELLCPDIHPAAAARCTLEALSCRSATAFTPAFWHPDLGSIEPTCMLLSGGMAAFPEEDAFPYWGFMMN